MAEQLRMDAVVVDRFTPPLKRLQNLLKETGRHDAKWLKNEWNSVGQTFDKITTGLSTGLNPALARIGVTSLGVSGAVTGIGLAIKSFATSTRDLNQFSRGIGLSVESLRDLRAVGEHFGMSWDQAQGSLKTFAGNMDQVRRRWGETYSSLRNMNLGELAERLVAAPNMEKAVEIAIEGLKSIQNPVRRRQVAELLFGSDQWATVASQLTPSLRKAIKDALGEIPAGSAEAAEAFALNWTKMNLSVLRFRNEAIGPLLPQVNELFGLLNRPETYATIKREWDDLTGGVKGFLAEIKGVAEMLRLLDKGDVGGALKELRKADGANGPLARLVAPLPGDDILKKEERLKQLKESEAWNERFPQRPGYATQQERLRKEIADLTAELKRLREQGGATVQPQSFDGSGFGGARLWNASLGGFGVRPFNGYGGGGAGSGPISAGRPGPTVARIPQSGSRGLRSLFGELPGEDGGGRYRPAYSLSEADLSQRVVDTIASEARLKSPGGADAVINNMLNRVGSKGWGPSRNLLEVSQAPGQYEGAWKGRRATAAESEFIRSRIRAIASGEVPDNTDGSNSFRASWYRGPWWRRYGQFGKDVGGNTFAYQPGTPNGPYAPYDRPREVAGGAATRVGDSMMGRAFGPGGVSAGAPRMEATGAVNIHLSGGLEKAPARVTMDGLFTDVQVNRGRQMAGAD